MTLKTCRFLTLQTGLTCFKTDFRLGGTLLFLRDSVDLGLLLAEILHQRNIAWADPGTGPALDTVRQVMGSGFIVLLAFTEPVELLREQIRRAGVGAGATANAAFLFLRLAHFAGRRGQQAVGDFDHRHVQPRQGEAHQRPAHDHQLFTGGAKTGGIKQVVHRRAQARPDVTRLRNGFAGQGHDALGQGFAIDNRTLNGKGGSHVLHQHADV